MQAAPVEPRGQVHGDVRGRQGEVHHDVVGGKHFVEAVAGHALGQVGGAGGEEARRLVVDARHAGELGIGAGHALDELAEGLLVQRRRGLVLGVADDDDFGPVGGQLQRIAHNLGELGVVDQHLGPQVVDEQGNFAA